MGVFNGMNVDASKGADGNFTIKLTEADFATFQVNQANAGSAPASTTSMQFNISMDASEFVFTTHFNVYIVYKHPHFFSLTRYVYVYSLHLEVTTLFHPGGYYILVLTGEQWELLQKMGVFDGMNIDAVKGADGQYTIKLTEADFAIFQINQAKGGSAPASSTSMQFSISRDSSE